jgi:hypothetical protein
LIIVFAEQVRHHVDAAVTPMIEARNAESRFHGLQQREAGVERVALHAMLAAETVIERFMDGLLELLGVCRVPADTAS